MSKRAGTLAVILVLASCGGSQASGRAANARMVAKALRQHMRAVQACYDDALKRNPKLTGRIRIHFWIGAGGEVTKLVIEDDTLREPHLTRCVETSARLWRFSPPAGGAAEVVAPIILRTAGAP